MEGEAGAMDDERYAEQDVDRTFEEEDEAAYEDNLKEEMLPTHQSVDNLQEEMLPAHQILAEAAASSGDEDDVISDQDPEEEEVEGQMLEEEGVAYRSLISLDLRNNDIASLREEVSAMQGLRVVLMCHNDVKELPVVIGQLPNLTFFAATHNKIRHVPADLGFLRRSLRTLRLDNNNLESVPAAFASLQALEELFLDQNRISEFGAGLLPGAFPALKRLFLNDNGLSKWISPPPPSSSPPPPPAGAIAAAEAKE
ncbi:hypothetical protein T484DRAFT_1903487, partial [Baffinella frigidus]